MGGYLSKRHSDDDDDDVPEEPEVRMSKYFWLYFFLMTSFIELTKIDTGDQTAVKNLLDDNVTEFFKNQEKYTINYSYDNMKMLLMVVAIIVSAGTHFNGTSFPENCHIILACAGGYVFFIPMKSVNDNFLKILRAEHPSDGIPFFYRKGHYPSCNFG
jgi:hypothetical protein